MGKRYLVSVNDTETLDIDSKNLYDFGLSQSLPCANSKFDNAKNLEKLLSTTDNADTGYVSEIEQKYTEKAKKYEYKFVSVQRRKKYQHLKTMTV